MKIIWDKKLPFLIIDNRRIPCSCHVRNELNGLRKKHEVIYTVPGHRPYYPRVFPNGTWTVGEPRAREDKYLAPFYIPTDAWQMVDVWEERDGMYYRKTDEQVKDTAYGLHFSESGTTQGCIKINFKTDLVWLVGEIDKCIDRNELVIIEVFGEYRR